MRRNTRNNEKFTTFLFFSRSSFQWRIFIGIFSHLFCLVELPITCEVNCSEPNSNARAYSSEKWKRLARALSLRSRERAYCSASLDGLTRPSYRAANVQASRESTAVLDSTRVDRGSVRAARSPLLSMPCLSRALTPFPSPHRAHGAFRTRLPRSLTLLGPPYDIHAYKYIYAKQASRLICNSCTTCRELIKNRRKKRNWVKSKVSGGKRKKINK